MYIDKQKKQNICQECGMILIHPAEFHPYEYCILWKNGQDPRKLYDRIVQHARQALSGASEQSGVDRIRFSEMSDDARQGTINAGLEE